MFILCHHFIPNFMLIKAVRISLIFFSNYNTIKIIDNDPASISGWIGSKRQCDVALIFLNKANGKVCHFATGKFWSVVKSVTNPLAAHV